MIVGELLMNIKTSVLIIFGIYAVIITGLLAYIIYGYSYDSIYLLFYWLSFYFFGLTVVYDFWKKGSFFTFGIIFNLFGALYTNYYIAELIIMDAVIDNEIWFSMIISYISIFSFDVAYYFFPKLKLHFKSEKKEVDVEHGYNQQRIMALVSFLLVVSLAVEFYVIFKKIGLSTFFSASRSTKTLLMSDYSILSFYQSTIPIIAVVSLAVNLEYKTKYSRFLFFVATAISLFNAYIRGSRAELICILLPIIFLLFYYKKITNKMVVIAGIGAVILFGIWKSLYSSQTSISYDSEFNTWYKICKNVLSSGFEYRYGRTYLTTVENLVIPVTHSTTLSTWYLQNYEASVLARGGGRGFSAVLEAYINFNVLGNIIIYFLYGVLLKTIEIKEYDGLERRFGYKVIIMCIIMSSMYLFFRAESYSLWKNMAWFKIYPTAIIFLVSRIKEDSASVIMENIYG